MEIIHGILKRKIDVDMWFSIVLRVFVSIDRFLIFKGF